MGHEMDVLGGAKPIGNSTSIEHTRAPQLRHNLSETKLSTDDRDTFILARLGKKQVLKVRSRGNAEVLAEYRLTTRSAAELWLHVHGGFQLYCLGDLGGCILVCSFSLLGLGIRSDPEERSVPNYVKYFLSST